MGVADEQIRVSETVRRKIERHQREGESYNDVLERILAVADAGDFSDGFGRWSDEEAERVSEDRRESKKKRQRRMRERTEDAA
jgi:predicted CopG family antitoxin